MFTGIIELVQPLLSVAPAAAGRRLTIDLGPLADDAKIGASINVNGVCLTVSRLQGSVADFDVMAQTLRLTTLGTLRPRDLLNLERALPANGRLGGHFVSGHIDGLGTVDQVTPAPDEHALWLRAPAEVIKYIIPQGSIAIDGVSLTVGAVEAGRFAVYLIPTTLRDTNLRLRRPGDPVNLEADLISKWIRRRLDEVLSPNPSALSLDHLRDQGF